jgi:hypothetical protein
VNFTGIEKRSAPLGKRAARKQRHHAGRDARRAETVELGARLGDAAVAVHRHADHQRAPQARIAGQAAPVAGQELGLERDGGAGHALGRLAAAARQHRSRHHHPRLPDRLGRFA